MLSQNEIAILDFGSQYTHLIARRIRELGVVSHIYPNDIPASKLVNAVGIILSGGPRSVVRDPKLAFDPKLFELGVPLLGLCYGHQLMADFFGGSVSSGTAREYGLATITVSPSKIFEKIKKQSAIWMSHGDHVGHLPPGFTQIAATGNDSIAAMEHADKRLYGFQFHPEVAHSTEGKKILRNFVFGICRAEKNWNTKRMLEQIEADVKKTAGDKNVFLLVSGGVDSTVCFALLEKVLGKKRVFGLHIDNGFMRLDETKKIVRALTKLGYKNLHNYNAEKEFLTALKGVGEPEQKRKIIGNLFLDITDRIMREKGLDGGSWLLGQGTIYPDTIESGGTKNADVIKTHHNRVPRIQQMILESKIIEPLKELYKDEVREIGLKLGLPKELIFRHPFPGPGLAIRCLCSEGSSEVARPLPLLSKERSPRRAGEVAVPHASLLKLPLKSVGVQGDERSYSHPAVITHLPPKVSEAKMWQRLAVLAPQITNQNKEVNRVLMHIGGSLSTLTKATLKKAHLTKTRLDLLRQIDDIVTNEVKKHPSNKKIWQLPVVLVPFGHQHGESIVLRPVESEEAMTVSFGKIPAVILKKIIAKVLKLKKIDYIFYDLTNKPPGTIEWE